MKKLGAMGGLLVFSGSPSWASNFRGSGSWVCCWSKEPPRFTHTRFSEILKLAGFAGSAAFSGIYPEHRRRSSAGLSARGNRKLEEKKPSPCHIGIS